MIQAFSPELCAHLSSLEPRFEGHYDWLEEEYYREGEIRKRTYVYCFREDDTLCINQRIICPAWQVEDVLRNWTLIIQSVEESKAEAFCTVCRKDENKCGCEFFGTESPKIPFGKYTAQKILSILILEGDTAYQKIEEYLWTILK